MSDDTTSRIIGHARDLFSSEHPVRSLVEAVCVTPRIYTLNGTLEEAAAFLEGFYGGMAAHTRNDAVMDKVEYWHAFCQWALVQLGRTMPGGCRDMFQILRRAYSDDTLAFARLATLYLAFRQVHQETTN